MRSTGRLLSTDSQPQRSRKKVAEFAKIPTVVVSDYD